MASLFEVNENGEIVYDAGSDGSASAEHGEAAADPEETGVESEVEDGSDNTQTFDSGTSDSGEIQGLESSSQTQESGESSAGGDDYGIMLLSDEVQTAVYDALTPASGTLGSSTLDYFDRIVSGLPSDYAYIGYRTNSDNSYDGVLYFGQDFDVENNVITFGEETTEIRVVRSSSSSYNSVTYYYETELDGAGIGYDLNGDVVYYTNAEFGYPILGGMSTPVEISPFIVVGLLCAMATVILQKLLLRK